MPRADKAGSDLLPGTLEMLVLRVLDIEPMHGYAIAQQLRRLSAEALKIEEGSIYPALQRLLVKGWVTASWQTSATKRRTRVYRLTAKGRRQLGVAHDNFMAMFAALSRVMNS